MNTQLTVNDLRIQIGSLFATADFLPYLNQALLRLIQAGRWKGAMVYADFPTSVSTGFLTLPYELISILGVSAGGVPLPVFTNMHEYIISGPGRIDETKPATGIVDFVGDGYPTRLDPPTAGSVLRIALTNAADIGAVFRIYGKDASGRDIFTATGAGLSVTTTGLNTDTAQVFSVVTGIEGPVDSTTGYSSIIYPWRLYSVAPDTTATELGYYYPNEARPSYARYKFGTWNPNDSDTLTIRTLCQRRFIPVYKDADWVIPGSVGALKAAMQAVQCEDANNYQQAAPLWVIAYGILNNEVHSARGGAKPELSLPQSQFMPDGGVWGYGVWGGSYGV